MTTPATSLYMTRIQAALPAMTVTTDRDLAEEMRGLTLLVEDTASGQVKTTLWAESLEDMRDTLATLDYIHDLFSAMHGYTVKARTLREDTDPVVCERALSLVPVPETTPA